MDESLSHWLGLRETADATARSERLTHAIAESIQGNAPLCVLDLAAGTGSNIRYLVHHLPGRQRWLAVDRSTALLAGLRERMSSWGAARGYEVRTSADRRSIRGAHIECDLETRQMDLALLDHPEIFAGRHLVTASALLDLVSERWLRALAARCRAECASVLFTITYNGRSSCDPVEPEDEMVRDLMHRHQKTDKGLGGPAAGPDAAACAEQCFVEAGYQVQREPSDWNLGPADTDVQKFLIEGWMQAATEMAPERASTIARWGTRRLALVDAGRSRIIVGHDDLAAWLPRRPTAAIIPPMLPFGSPRLAA
ncbi:MAG: class I SAM-dependent methyltransferase, partial [Acidobacteria bacterium]|nr:class I SAM-dependent methyltransferase [Acidobacteriota bacterium]